MARRLSQFINSQSVEAQGELRVSKDSTGSALYEWKAAEEMEVIQAIQAAKKFLNRPVAWPLQERKETLLRLKKILSEKASAWAKLEAAEQGLPLPFVHQNGFEAVQFIIDRNIKALEEATSGLSQVLRAPTGVIAILTPWSLSFRVAMESLIPSLAAGNASIVKVSSKSSVTSLILQELLSSAEVPEGSVGVLLGEGSRIGSFLAAHPGVRGVSFVGQAKNAEALIKTTSSQFKKLRVRGGTKNVAIVLPGFDYSNHFQELMESFLVGQGRLGWGMSRLLTTENELPKLKEHLEKFLSQPQKTWGSYNPEILKTLTQKAKDEHGKVLQDKDSPVFLLDLPNCSDLQQEELGVPLFPIVTVKYQHELAKWANNSPYGSLAVLWGDPEKAMKLAEKLEFGSIWINHWMRPSDQSPWGLKQSAFGIIDDLATGSFFCDQKLTQ